MAKKPSPTQVKPTVLGDFDGREVIMCAIAIPNASGGLHDAIALDPIMFHTGDDVDIVLRCKVGRIAYDPILDKGEDTGYYSRVATLSAKAGVFAEASDVDELFTKQRKRIETARGVQSIPGIDA